MDTKTENEEVTQPVQGENPVSEALVTIPQEFALTRPPDVVLEEAHKAAKALVNVLSQKSKKVIMGGEQYIEYEDWQLLGRFYGVTAKSDGEPEFVQMGDVYGFKASAVALLHGEVISRATAFCLSDEEKWSSRAKYEWVYVLKSGGHSVEDPGVANMVWEDNPDKPGKKRPKKLRLQVGEEKVPLFQLASMAQTRACAKAFRNVLSWVVVLAGFRPTPAEEIMDMPQTVVKQANGKPQASKWVPNSEHYEPDDTPWPDDVVDVKLPKKEYLPPPAGYEGPKQAVPVEKGDASYKQLQFIRELCKKMKLDPDEEAREQLGKRLTELSTKDASQLIEYLKGVGY